MPYARWLFINRRVDITANRLWHSCLLEDDVRICMMAFRQAMRARRIEPGCSLRECVAPLLDLTWFDLTFTPTPNPTLALIRTLTLLTPNPQLTSCFLRPLNLSKDRQDCGWSLAWPWASREWRSPSHRNNDDGEVRKTSWRSCKHSNATCDTV